MKGEATDYQINASVRSVLTRHGIDTQEVSFGSFRGVVRVSGAFRHLQGGSCLNLGSLEALGADLRSIHGVKRVSLDPR